MPKTTEDFSNTYKGQPDWELIKKFVPFAEFMRYYHSYRVDGMSKIPEKGRAMVLVNHSLATYDILLLGYTILYKMGRLPYGLADSNFYKNEFTTKLMHKIAMYEANHENAEDLLRTDNLLLLAPGGTKEAIRSSKEKFKIIWNERKGFAKLAIKTQSPIILAACPGADNVYNVSESKLTDLAYKFLKLPVPIAKGIGNTILPRPVKLVHYIHEPIIPPYFEGENPPEDMIDAFHLQIVEEMEEWMQNHLKLYDKG
jgi:1-acyl-sn-glycerol-3-phosphate acyltransferase